MIHLGWAMGHNPRTDRQTGVYHLLVAHKKGNTPRFACGFKGTDGAWIEEPVRKELKCGRCQHWIRVRDRFGAAT